MKLEFIKIFGFAFFLIGIFGCDTVTFEDIEEEPTNPGQEIVSFTEDVQPIITTSCVFCHSQGGAAEFYPLTNFMEVSNGIDNIIDRVERPDGDPLRMPQGGSLSSSQINVLNEWRNQGLIETE